MRYVSQNTVKRFVSFEDVRQKDAIATSDVGKAFPSAKIVGGGDGGTDEI